MRGSVCNTTGYWTSIRSSSITEYEVGSDELQQLLCDNITDAEPIDPDDVSWRELPAEPVRRERSDERAEVPNVHPAGGCLDAWVAAVRVAGGMPDESRYMEFSSSGFQMLRIMDGWPDGLSLSRGFEPIEWSVEDCGSRIATAPTAPLAVARAEVLRRSK